jgi:hypothetical protein
MKPIQHGILEGKEDRPLSGGRALILVEHSASSGWKAVIRLIEEAANSAK